jgi:hypothetical protein
MSATLPSIFRIKERRYFWRSGIERYKADLAGLPFHAPASPDELIPIKKFAGELGVCVRTVERRISEASKAPA